MIIFNLICADCNQEFEGWFDSSKEFEKQKRKKIISCPACNNHSIKKSLMTPNLNKKTNAKNANNNKKTVINKINKY